MFTVRGIVLHLTASPFGDARQVDRWHRERGFSGIGYHHVILNGVRISGRQYNVADDGVHERGRAETVQGAHCAAGGMNRVTLGVSCIGTPDRVPTGAQRAPATVTTKPYMTARQFATLVELLATLCTKYSLDPRGTFAHPVTGAATPVLSQHSQWDSGKPFCASVQIAAIREAVAAALAARGTRRRGGRRGTLARPLVLDDAQAIAVGDPSLEPDADPQLDGSDVGEVAEAAPAAAPARRRSAAGGTSTRASGAAARSASGTRRGATATTPSSAGTATGARRSKLRPGKGL